MTDIEDLKQCHNICQSAPPVTVLTGVKSTDISYQFPTPGPTPLHLAARCGSLETTSCLLANYANMLSTDHVGLQ